MPKYRIRRVEYPKAEFIYFFEKRWLFWWFIKVVSNRSEPYRGVIFEPVTTIIYEK